MFCRRRLRSLLRVGSRGSRTIGFMSVQKAGCLLQAYLWGPMMNIGNVSELRARRHWMVSTLSHR